MIWPFNREEHRCYWRREYDKFNEAYKAAVARCEEIRRECAGLRQTIGDLERKLSEE